MWRVQVIMNRIILLCILVGFFLAPFVQAQDASENQEATRRQATSEQDEARRNANVEQNDQEADSLTVGSLQVLC